MARIGMNPARGQRTDYRPARVTVAVLVHIPHFEGYFRQRLQVLKLCLGSLLANTAEPHDLLVFDNGSCPEVGALLKQLEAEGNLDYLVRSRRNLGKLNALQVLFRAAPGALVAYCDADFFFYPGWLGSHLEIYDTYPNVGMVTGYVVRHLFAEARTSANLTFAETEEGVTVERGDLIPEEWTRDWALSTGRDPQEFLSKLGGEKDIRLQYRGLKAFAAANHDQFLAPKNVIAEALPLQWTEHLMGQMLELDEAVNAGGFLRLSTGERTTRHIGNTVPADLLDRLPDGSHPLGIRPSMRPASVSSGIKRRLLRWPPVRSLLLGLYSRLFKWINVE